MRIIKTDSEKLSGIVVQEPRWRRRLRNVFKEEGRTEINGHPIEEMLMLENEKFKKLLLEANEEIILLKLEEALRAEIELSGVISSLEDPRDRILNNLRQAGITVINNKPIEQFVTYARKMSDFI